MTTFPAADGNEPRGPFAFLKHCKPVFAPLAVGMAAAVGYSVYLSAALMPVCAKLPTDGSVQIPLHFDIKGRPGTFVSPKWGTWVYPICTALMLGSYLFGDRRGYSTAETSIIHAAAVAILILAQTTAHSVVTDGRASSNINLLKERGAPTGYGLDVGVLGTFLAIMAVVTIRSVYRLNKSSTPDGV